MVPKTTPYQNDTTVSVKLYLAFELSQAEWKPAFMIGLGRAPRLRTLKGHDLTGLRREIEQAKARFGLSKEAAVLSGYEAGQDGFWLYRYPESIDANSLVVDSASIEVNRRFRRAAQPLIFSFPNLEVFFMESLHCSCILWV
jgi:transposase